MFKLLDKGQSSEDAFDILSELYERNALQAKYHDQYYYGILYHAYLVSGVRTLEENSPTISYSEQRTAELFLDSVKQNPSTLYPMIGALRFLNSKFRKNVISASEDIMVLFGDITGVIFQNNF